MRERTPILCVDDEPEVLEALRDSLRRHFDVQIATSGPEGLARLAAEPDRFRIVISDLRMPGQSGAAFLAEVRRVAPHAVRILLTGHSDVASAIKAVNEGQIFRFLTKPCERDELLRACTAGLHHYSVMIAQGAALDRVLAGSVTALTELLAHTSPQAHRLALRAGILADHLLGDDTSEQAQSIRTAANLAYIGSTPGSDAADAPDLEVARRVLASIPRLDGVLRLLADVGRTDDQPLSAPAAIVATALAYAAHEARGLEREEALALLRAEPDRFGAAPLDAFSARLEQEARDSVREVLPRDLRAGMQLVGDLRTDAGGMLVAAGETLTDALLERLAAVLAQRRTPITVATRAGARV